MIDGADNDGTLGEFVADLRRHLAWAAELDSTIPREPAAPAPPEAATGPTSRTASIAAATTEPAVRPLEEIRAELGDCHRCRLAGGRRNIVFGIGNPKAELVFVGEGPGPDEDIRGEPFVGAAGQLLDKMIEAMGFKRSEVYICNVVKCLPPVRPPNNRFPEDDEIAACSPFLHSQLASVRPKVIVALGKCATQTLLGSRASVSRVRGTWHEYRGIKLMPTFHPAYLLRSPHEKRKAWEDLQKVMKELPRPRASP